MAGYRILHLSDTHLLADGALHYDLVDTTANLRRVLERAAGIGALDLVIVTGDCSEDGSRGSYAALRSIVEPWAEQRGARAVFVMGNHDLPEGFGAELGDGAGGAAPVGPIDAVVRLGGLRLIVLDSSVAGAGYGRLEPEQLARLRDELAAPAPDGTVVALHHPPVPAATELLQGLALQQPEALAEAVGGSDVRLILAGHYHHPLVATLAGVPVVVSTAVTNLADVLGDPGVEQASFSSGGTLIELDALVEGAHDQGLRVLPFHVPVPREGEPVFRLDEQRVAQIIEAAGPPMS